MTSRQVRIEQLHRERPQRPFVRASALVMTVVVAVCWAAGNFQLAGIMSPPQRANAARFLAELRPWPLQQTGAPSQLAAQVAVAWRWWGQMWREGGAEATATTLALSLVAILLAGLWGSLMSLLAARNLARPEPFLRVPSGAHPGRRVLWRAALWGTRGALMLVRAVPEYIWAFLLLGVYGPTVWPLILALALHNTGILGKLTAEVIENADTRAPEALHTAGVGRATIALTALVPLSLPRFLLYFFYRWETCVRESTVLGMLGVASLGYGLVQARARNAYDEMVFYIACGVVLVVVGDVVSHLVRRFLRSA